MDLVLRLFDSYALPLGLYASQIWSTPLLHETKQLDNDLKCNVATQPSSESWLEFTQGCPLSLDSAPCSTSGGKACSPSGMTQWQTRILPSSSWCWGQMPSLQTMGARPTGRQRCALLFDRWSIRDQYQVDLSFLYLWITGIRDSHSYWDQFQADTGGYRDPHSLNRPVRTYAQCFLPTPSASHLCAHAIVAQQTTWMTSII